MGSKAAVENRTTQVKHVKALNDSRSVVYGFLSRAFKAEVDEDFLENIASVETAIRLVGEIDLLRCNKPLDERLSGIGQWDGGQLESSIERQPSPKDAPSSEQPKP